LKKEKLVEIQKIEADSSSNGMENKEKLFQEVTIKIRLRQEDNEEGIVVEALLNSITIELVISLKFVRKN